METKVNKDSESEVAVVDDKDYGKPPNFQDEDMHKWLNKKFKNAQDQRSQQKSD